MATADLEPLHPIREACRILGVRERTARGWAAAGYFPVVRLGRRTLRVRLSDLKAFIDSRTAAGGSR
jgi:excisionase family DNA binding protein